MLGFGVRMVGGMKMAIALLLMLLMMVAAAVEFRGRGETLDDHPHKVLLLVHRPSQ